MRNDPSLRSSRGHSPRAALVLFLEEHILPWAGLCLKKASEEAATDFYREIPVLCWTTISNLALF
jgi:TorA maturation chaperone TorD